MRVLLKKGLSVLLILSMLLSFIVLQASAARSDAPTVFLYGYGAMLVSDKTDISSETIFPVQMPEDFASQVVEKVKQPIAKGVLLNQWDDFHRVVIDSVCELYEPFALNENGDLRDNSGNPYAVYTYPLNDRRSDGGYDLFTYNFSYDWRLDPFAVAESLHTYIQEVCKATGYDKVNLVGRCLGCNIIMTYLQMYGSDYVDQVCYYAPGFSGFECMEAFFSGDINFDVDAIPDYFDHAGRAQLAPGDNPPYDLLITALQFLNAAKMLNVAEPIFDKYLVPEFKKYILPEIMRRTFGTLPGMWSFIGEDAYEEAKDVIFGDAKEAYAGLIEKTDRYHNEILLRAKDIVSASVDAGVETYIVVKYGSRMVPIVQNATAQSDSTVCTSNSSLGAYTAPLYGTFADSFVEGVQVGNGGKYLAPDRQIDASTCLLPDHTWFIKNLYHHENPDQVDDMIAALFNHDGYTSVFDLEQYPQYLIYDRDTDSVSLLSAESPVSKAPKYSFFKKLFDFWKLLFSFLKKNG